jgi:hypothetical protein
VSVSPIGPKPGDLPTDERESRPLTTDEADELRAFALTSMAEQVSSCLVISALSLAPTAFFVWLWAHRPLPSGTAFAFVGQFVLVALVITALRRSAATTLRENINADLATGLVPTPRGWKLTATDMEWEVDGRPGRRRLERQQTEAQRSPVTPSTF